MTDAELIEYQHREIKQLQKLLSYYRSFAPPKEEIWVAPPGYFSHQTQGKWVAGRLVDGHLEILASDLVTEEEAVIATQRHYESIHHDASRSTRRSLYS